MPPPKGRSRTYSANPAFGNDVVVGGMLATLGLRAGGGQLPLADYLKVSKSLVSEWELGHSSVPGEFMPKIKKFFEEKPGNIDVEYQEMLMARFPPLDPKWLEDQPLDKRAGLLLSTYRQLRGLRLEDVATLCKTSVPTVGKWEAGDLKIHAPLFNNKETNPLHIQKLLHLKASEFENLLEARWPSMAKGFAKANIDHRIKGGMMLADWRDRLGLSQWDMVKILWEGADTKNTTQRVVLSNWERGMDVIPLEGPQYERMVKLFKEASATLSPIEHPFSEENFRSVVKAANVHVVSMKFVNRLTTKVGAKLPAKDPRVSDAAVEPDAPSAGPVKE